MTMTEMLTAYRALSASHLYLIGFSFRNYVYYVLQQGMIEAEMLKLDRASSKRGGFAKIRVHVKAADRQRLVESGAAIQLCHISELTADAKHNKGENFERVVTEKLTDERWVKDNIPFNVAGDIVLNGENVQIKLDCAELTNEKILAKLLGA